jgi:collagen triple helix repeat protein
MLSKIRRRMTWANVAMTLALVFAMSGGAYAAKKYLITSTKQISPKVLKQLQGKAGPAGPQGPMGPQGAVGANGKDGAAGKNGAPGEKGTNGTSVTSVEKAAGVLGPCKEGGSEFTSASGKTYACNGKEGKAGKEGEPWTAGGTLPSGAQETGTWALNKLPATLGLGALKIPISFPIPLQKALGETEVHVIPSEAGQPGEPAVPTGCVLTRNATAETIEVEAEPGNLCVYIQYEEEINNMLIVNPEHNGELGAGRDGAILSAASAAAGAFGDGFWAVRAP